MASRTTSAAIPASGSTTSRNTPSVVSPAASGPVRPSRRANTPCAGMNNTAVKAPSSAGAANGWTTQKAATSVTPSTTANATRPPPPPSAPVMPGGYGAPHGTLGRNVGRRTLMGAGWGRGRGRVWTGRCPLRAVSGRVRALDGPGPSAHHRVRGAPAAGIP